ncbi:IS3 family transposase [Sporohalobacter salinus]|uniref:IS3 family transposase n=1 Tax=Sporohalobacter salinus TaxID=1494606 RepID=UPI00195FA4CA|nr:IS3 family transposase [Sporohalobacter salinus]MBM7624964.1 putative transposase [Sporohalobacter salinus]
MIIDDLKFDYTVTKLCKTFNISRSTYYYRKNNNDKSADSTDSKLYSGYSAYDKEGNLVPEKRIIELVENYCDKYPYWGYRMVTAYLNFKHNLKVNHKRIYRIMKVLNLLQDRMTPKPDNYQLKQKHELTGPDQLWEMDMVQMYIDKSGQWVYMFDIIDVYTREIVGHHESLRCRTKEALKALKQAVESRDTNNLILRTDNGTQFRSRNFQRYLKQIYIEHERIAVNTPEENSHIESFHGTLKRSEVYQKHYKDIMDCKESIADFIDRYNTDRPHSGINSMPPTYYKKQIV